jgi:hypothetical protein
VIEIARRDSRIEPREAIYISTGPVLRRITDPKIQNVGEETNWRRVCE